MADFRAYSEKYDFRHRSETPGIAVELSLQPWRKFGVDGVIMFSGDQHVLHCIQRGELVTNSTLSSFQHYQTY